jgi:hypothetical protein
MFDWFNSPRGWYAMGWLGIGVLAIVIVLVFVRRLVGIDG